MNNQMIKNKLAQATTIIPPIASLHLFLFQNASFFIFVACILIWYYVFLNLISNTVEFSCFFNYKLYFLLVLKHFLNVLWHHLLQICQFSHENIFVVCNLCVVEKILKIVVNIAYYLIFICFWKTCTHIIILCSHDLLVWVFFSKLFFNFLQECKSNFIFEICRSHTDI